jgi:glycosyltransferase involved in cell wall biosynthesis
VILSVVIPTHNKKGLLVQTLAALAEQDVGSVPWEIVVVDDGSRDGTGALLHDWQGQLAGRLQVVAPPGNVGRAAARNLGLRAAQGRWILFLDDDILAPAGLLAAHLDLLEGHAGSATIGCVRTAPALIDAPHFHYIDSRGVAKVPSGQVPARYFVTQNAAVAREALLQVGGFDERFQAYGMEDMEIAFRLEDHAGVTFLGLREPVPVHLHHHNLAQYLDKKRECGRTSLPLLAALHPRRIREMRLHWVVDLPGAGGAPLPIRALRGLAVRSPGRLLGRVLSRWPCHRDHRPRMRSLYDRLLDIMILGAYRQGIVEASCKHATMTAI